MTKSVGHKCIGQITNYPYKRETRAAVGTQIKPLFNYSYRERSTYVKNKSNGFFQVSIYTEKWMHCYIIHKMVYMYTLHAKVDSVQCSTETCDE